MANAAIKTLDDRKPSLIPARIDKTYQHWLEKSLTGVFPVIFVGTQDPGLLQRSKCCEDGGMKRDSRKKCPKCGSTHMHQDEDTLDTCYSSALVSVLHDLMGRIKTPELE